MTRIPATWLAFALLLPLPAFAQEDDSEYARGLAQRGWFDLAETICRRITDNPASKPEVKGAVAFVRAEILIAKANREAEVEKAKPLYDEAIGILEGFVKGFPTHTLILDARINIGWLKARKAKFLADAMEQESSPEHVAELSKDAHKLYDEAEKYYRGLLEELAKLPRTDASEDAIMNARYEIPRTMYEHAKIPGLPDDQRKKLLTDSLKPIEDVQWDYGNQVMNYKGALLNGQILIELADYKTAEVRLRGAISLQEKLREYRVKATDFHHEVIFGGYINLAKLFNRQGKSAEALTLVEQALREAKNADNKDWEGLLLLEKAESMALMKNADGAVKIATAVQKSNPRLAGLAQRRMNEWSGKSGSSGVRVSADQMWTSAETSIGKAQYTAALVSLRHCIEAIVGEDERQKYAARAYYNMGACYQELRRYYEAANAFELVFTQFPKHELAAAACSYAIDAYSKEFAVSGSKVDDEAADRLLAHLASAYSGSPEAKGATFTRAQKLFYAGKRDEAIKAYREVDKAASRYEDALVWAGIASRLEATDKQKKAPKDPAVQAETKALLLQADGFFQEFLKRLDDKSLAPTTPERIKDRSRLIAMTYEQAALVYNHELIGRAEDCLKMLDQWAKTIAPDDDSLGKCWALQIQAHLALNHLPESIKTLDAMFERFPDGFNIARACKSVADRLYDASEENRKNKGDPAQLADYLQRISRYYTKWIDEGLAKGLPTSMKTVVEVAKILYYNAKEINGLGSDISSFVDLKDKKVLQRQYFSDAALVLSNLVDERLGKVPPADRVELATRLARCYSFTANDASDWSQAKAKYDDILKGFKLLDARGQVDNAVLSANPGLLDIYIELGSVYLEIARANPAENSFQFDNATDVFIGALKFLSPGSERFWVVRYTGLLIYLERGKEGDLKLAKISLESLERNYPDFDGGKYGMKERFNDLKAKIARLNPK